MSNQWLPPPAGPPWGSPPSQGGPPQFPQPYVQPPGPPSSAKRGCLIAAVISTIVLAGACVGGILWTRSAVHGVEHRLEQGANNNGVFVPAGTPMQPLESQAAVLGRDPSDVTACRYNSAELQSETQCASYLAWIATNAPFLPGATLTASNMSMHPNARGQRLLEMTVVASGPHGSGRFQAQLLFVDDHWMVRGLRPL